MSKQWNGIIATQTAHINGVSMLTVDNSGMPKFRSITSAVYGLNVGGVSGTCAITVFGFVGGHTQILAGNTAITAGKKILYPALYGADGVMDDLETVDTIVLRSLDNSVPPSSVRIESLGATDAHGFSGAVTLSACIYAD